MVCLACSALTAAPAPPRVLPRVSEPRPCVGAAGHAAQGGGRGRCPGACQAPARCASSAIQRSGQKLWGPSSPSLPAKRSSLRSTCHMLIRMRRPCARPAQHRRSCSGTSTPAQHTCQRSVALDLVECFCHCGVFWSLMGCCTIIKVCGARCSETEALHPCQAHKWSVRLSGDERAATLGMRWPPSSRSCSAFR